MVSPIFKSKSKELINLPDPIFKGDITLEQTLHERRSCRNFTNKPLALWEVSQLLWAALGVTHPDGLRTVPSAGALYPLEIYAVVGNVENLPEGIYRYKPFKHELEKIAPGNKRSPLYIAALRQDFIRSSSVVLIITAIYERTTWKYGERGKKYVHMEIGHVAQNISLQSVALNLGTVVVGAFDDGKVKEVLNLPENEHPLCIMPIGRTE